MAKKWMQHVAKTMDKGALHRDLHVPEGEKIPAEKLKAAEHSPDPTTRKRAFLAETFAHHRPGATHAHHG